MCKKSFNVACRFSLLFSGLLVAGCTSDGNGLRLADKKPLPASDRSMPYPWTTDHMQVGVRWQPFGGRPKNNAFDATRAVIAKDSSYAQFWVAWSAMEPTEAHTDYAKNPSDYLKPSKRRSMNVSLAD